MSDDPRFKEWLFSRDYGRLTIEAYIRTTQAFAAFLGERGQGLLDASDESTHEFIAGISKRSGASTTNRHASAIVALRTFLCQPPIKFNRPLRERTHVTAAPSSDELDRLWSAARAVDGWIGVRDEAMLRIAHSAALRVSQLIMIRMSDVTAPEIPGDAWRLRIHDTHGERVIVLNAEASNALRAWMISRKKLGEVDTVRLFVSSRKEAITRQGAWVRMQVLAKKAGIDEISLRSLRVAPSARQ